MYCLADSQADQDLDQQRHSAGSSERFVPYGWSQEPKGGVQQNWKRQELSVLDGCVLGCKSGCSTIRKRASNLGTVRDTPRHCKDEKLGKNPCVVASLDADQEAKVRTCTMQASVKLTPRISLVPRPSHTCEKEALVF